MAYDDRAGSSQWGALLLQFAVQGVLLTGGCPRRATSADKPCGPRMAAMMASSAAARGRGSIRINVELREESTVLSRTHSAQRAKGGEGSLATGPYIS